MKVKFKPLRDDFEMPEQATEGAAGFDLRYRGDHPVTFGQAAGQVEVLDLGFSMELPPGFEAQIRPRSGLAAKHGITVLNSPGTIDADYRGPVKVILVKTGVAKVVDGKPERLPTLTIEPGDRVCQMVIQNVPEVSLSLVEDVSETERGEGGFGSTGVK